MPSPDDKPAPIDAALRAEIFEAEENLREAMLTSDAERLADLLAGRLIFTTHAGELIGKEQDLVTHRSGALRLSRIELSDRRMMEVAGVVIVSALADLAGTHDGADFAGRFRYTRVWSRDRIGRWQVIVGHASALVP